MKFNIDLNNELMRKVGLIDISSFATGCTHFLSINQKRNKY